MRPLLPAIFLLFSVACHAVEPVDSLLQSLSGQNLWQNGLFPTVNLPASASPRQVAAESLRNARIDKFTIVEVREVIIPGASMDKYSAVVVDSAPGQKIVLLRHLGPGNGWWTRIYDAK